MAAVRQLTLWSFLVWCYRDQKAHLYLKRPMDWFLWRLAFDGVVEQNVSVHPDAMQLHAAVCGLTKEQAEAIVFFAGEAQEQPHPPSSMPTAFPTRVDYVEGLADGERIDQFMANGRGVQYLVRWHEQVGVAEPVYRRYGKRLRRLKDRIVKYPVEFCPLDWRPSLDWLIAIGHIHARWLGAMTALEAALAGQTFRNHTVLGSGIESDRPAAVNEWQSWAELQERIGMRAEEVGVDLSRDKITTQDGETFYRRSARAEHV